MAKVIRTKENRRKTAGAKLAAMGYRLCGADEPYTIKNCDTKNTTAAENLTISDVECFISCFEDVTEGLAGKRIKHGGTYLTVPTLTRTEIRDFIKAVMLRPVDKNENEIEALFDTSDNIYDVLRIIKFLSNNLDVVSFIASSYGVFLENKYRKTNPNITDDESYIDAVNYSPLNIDIIGFLSADEWEILLISLASDDDFIRDYSYVKNNIKKPTVIIEELTAKIQEFLNTLHIDADIDEVEKFFKNSMNTDTYEPFANILLAEFSVSRGDYHSDLSYLVNEFIQELAFQEIINANTELNNERYSDYLSECVWLIINEVIYEINKDITPEEWKQMIITAIQENKVNKNEYY